MCQSTDGSGEELEKFPDTLPLPEIAIHTPTGGAYAGLKPLDHYKRKLPPWRYNLRHKLLPLIRWETPYLAWMQDRIRSPAMDSYFAITANLGTHTFFMTALPILFWCGYTDIGRGLVHVLMSGVFLTGFLKDLFSLPRPLSPPLHRINMSGSAALEYGFPSTHTTNAVSVAVLFLLNLRSPTSTLEPSTRISLEILSYGYMFSIGFGRLYCGMHGFFDVFIGSIIGCAISFVEFYYGPAFDDSMHNGSWVGPCLLAVFIFALVRIHPEPADDCPCFDDSVAVAGVMVGVELGSWHFSSSSYAWSIPSTATVPFDLTYLGLPKTISRVLVGVIMIFAWREVMKPFLLKFLPHLFRIIERNGLALPRKFFMSASEYNKIPSRQKMDNIMPSVSDLPALLTSIRHPGRGRSVSVGPQSAADAYETLAYRNKRRRDSKSQDPPLYTSRPSSPLKTAGEKDYFSQSVINNASGLGATPAQASVSSYEQMMGSGQVLFTPKVPGVGGHEIIDGAVDANEQAVVGVEGELNETEIFENLEKPRRRYDVEVVTKLVVYSGIAWLAVEGNPLIFELIGLGMSGFVPDFQR